MLPGPSMAPALVHEGDLEIEIDPTDDQEKDEDDVGDRRIEVAADFARKESVKLTHGLSIMKTKGSKSKSAVLQATLDVCFLFVHYSIT